MELICMEAKRYLQLLASDAPAPGGGSASALCGAQGAALIAMTARLTLGRARYAARHEACQAIAAEADSLSRKLAAQVDLDAGAYSQMAGAFQLPKETGAQQTARREAVEAATLHGAEVPLETMRLAVEGLQCAAALAEGYNHSCASDLGCGAYGLLACVKGAWLNVLINAGGLSSREDADRLRTEGGALVRRAEELSAALDKLAAAHL